MLGEFKNSNYFNIIKNRTIMGTYRWIKQSGLLIDVLSICYKHSTKKKDDSGSSSNVNKAEIKNLILLI